MVAPFTNSGVVNVEAGTLALDGGGVSSANISVTSGAGIQFGGGAIVNAGTFLKTGAGSTSTVNVPFSNNGTVSIQSAILAADGGYVSATNALLNCALGGTTAGVNYGQLQVGGSVTLNGTLSVNFINNYIPATNTSFILVSAGSRNGTFSKFIYPSNQVAMVLSNTATSVVAIVTNVFTLPGRPVLHLDRLSATSGLLYWSTNFPNYFLEYNPSLGATNWAASGLTPVIAGTNFVATNALSSAQRFYRLSSVPATYTPPPPVLFIQMAPPGAVRLLWPIDPDRPFLLQRTTNLLAPNWMTVTSSPEVLATNNVVTNAVSGTRQFYRLSNH